MSFSSETKAELCHAPLSAPCCLRAEAYGVLLFCHTFSAGEIRIITTCPDFARRLPRLFERAFGLAFDVLPPENARGKRTFLITDKEKILKIFDAFGQQPELAVHLNLPVLENECCRSAFLRGAFLAGGSITDPDRGYHLELITSHQSVSGETHVLLREMDLAPRTSRRGANHVLYYKQSETIADVLSRAGASLAGMSVLQSRMEKDFRNTVNRRVNCDSANADKIVLASRQQVESIRRIDALYGLDSLPDDLQQTAMLRLVNPEASLTDLARLAIPPVSKSCISHRMKKLLALLEEQE